MGVDTLGLVSSKRRHRRFPFPSDLEICRIGQSGWMTARAKNISNSGLCFETAIPLAVGERIRVALANSDEHIATEVTICYVNNTEQSRFLVGAEH